jgi:hypothetical protein
MDDQNLPVFLHSQARLQPGMFAANRPRSSGRDCFRQRTREIRTRRAYARPNRQCGPGGSEGGSPSYHAIRDSRTASGMAAGAGALGRIWRSHERFECGREQCGSLLGKFGRGAGVLGTFVALDDILTSPDHMRALTANVGAGMGRVSRWCGRCRSRRSNRAGRPRSGTSGWIAGCIAGGRLGYRTGENVYDFLANW